MTKTREQLKADYESALEELQVEESIRQTLKDRGIREPRMVHQYGLYGSVGSIVFGDSFDRSDDKVTLEQLRDLLKSLPPVNQVKGKGTFTRFMTEQFADSDANEEKDREELQLVFPVTLKTNSVCGFSVKAEWFTEVDGQIWSVDAYLANPYSIAQVAARRVEFKGGFRYENVSLTVSSAFNPPEGYWERVKWGRGSDEYPNDFTAYHGQYDDDPVAWVDRAIAAIAAKESEMQPAI